VPKGKRQASLSGTRESVLISTSREPQYEKQFNDLVKLVRASGLLTLFCHQNADPDSLCSAFALKTLIEKIAVGTDVHISVPGGVNAPTKHLIRNLGLIMPEKKAPDKIGVAVLVDTNNLDQLGAQISTEITRSSIHLVVVDHHHEHPEMKGRVSIEIMDSTSSSTAEIVARLYEISRVSLDEKMAEALLAAIFVETRYFTLATQRTFEDAANLVAAGADPKKIPALLVSPGTRSERIARLKAAQRLKVEVVGNWLLVVSEVGSYQSSAARALLPLGADVAVVGGKAKGGVRVNLRSTQTFHRNSGIHLARDVAIPLGKELGGSGGGHPTAAGLMVNGTVEETLTSCTRLLRTLIEKSKVQT
jgi:nanoRNase/pAp phosphatase (c-di-AMP/oligoRNAs hydrolase)